MSKHRTQGTIRRLLSGLLCLALLLGLLPAGLTLPAQAASWADPYGQKLVDWGVMRGDISGNLNLDRPITRAEFVTMINRAYGYNKKGATPFTDVPSSRWYAEDIGIAYNAGYFKGTSSTTASPESNLTREQAAVILARNLMLQETTGESLGFNDSRTFSEWSRGLIGASVVEGVLTGYSDGSFRPFNNITRGEVAAMLVRSIGNQVNQPGDHSLGHVYGNVTISSSNVNLRNTTIAGNLYISGGVDLGHVLLENVTVLGRIVVSGAGESISGQESVVLRNVEADELVIDSLRSPFVTVRAQGVTDIPLVSVRTNAYLDDSSWDGYGLTRIELDGAPGAKLQLAGSVKEVVNLTPASDLQFVKGSAEKVTVDEYAIASKLLVDTGARVDELNLDVATDVTGKGDIKNLNVGSAGSTVEQLPDKIVIRPGIDADIDGETIGSSEAAEMSAEPRILAGYPRMQNISPDQAEGVYSGNKPGTIYWAISAVADGSVSEEDLISNPTYGGNIFEEQAGSIDAAKASTEYLTQVENLEPDGSYYVTTMLVDGRGKRSPIKVAAFSTPDDTTPAFVKDPVMTKITTETAQATIMANKSCLLYWALLPEGAQAPTPQEFRTGSLGGNYGYGSLSVLKNAEISVTVNRQKLREKQTYDLFLWLTDHNGAQSMAAPFRLTFTTPDETPPVVTTPIQIPPYGADTANVTFSMNEAPATLFWAVVPEGDTSFIASGTDMSDLRTKIRVESASDAGATGSGATAAGKSDVGTAYADVRFQINRLVAESGTNNFTMYYIGKDAAGNYSEKVESISIKTLDTTPPEVSINFTDAVEGRPRASSVIQLVFTETVKGGGNEGGKTFLDFYQEVLNAPDNGTRAQAKNALAKELAAHIKMYSVPRNGQPLPETPRGGFSGVEPDDRDNWVIDFHNAVVEQVNGKMVITLPNDTDDPDASALQLSSGATYYFQLIDVFDNAFIPNGVMDDPNGNYRLENFTTIYGQVELARNTSETYIDADDPNYAGIRLDMCVDVKPESTENMPITEYWDMIIWSDIGIDVEIYYQKDGGAWELLNSKAIPIEPAGIGLGTRSEVTSPSHQIQRVKESLLEGSTYRYGIHITRVGNTAETDKTAEPQDWSELVTMRFSLVAGTQGDIQNLSRSVSTNYDKFVNVDKAATEIGIEYLQTGTRRILEYPKQFTDTRVPEFVGGYPRFEAGSGTISMRAPLMREGTVWWVAAPVGNGGIPTTLPDGTEINSDNDGSKTGTTFTERTYIPISGSDRDGTNSDYIHFKTGGTGGTAGQYSAPYYRNIIDPSAFKSEDVKSGRYDYTGSSDAVTITGLKPKTWYYIYIVRQGGGDPNQIVEIYRVETTEVNVPSIVVTGTSTTADMTPTEDSELYFALVEYNNLPDFIRNTDIGGVNVLTLMTKRAGDANGPSAFDSSTATTDQRKTIAEYIMGTTPGLGSVVAGRWHLPDGQTHNGILYKDPISAGQTVTWSFENEMTAPNSEYVVLVIARHRYGGTGGDDFGFGAARALYTPDKVPPEFEATKPGFLISNVEADNATGQDWRNKPLDFTYSGSVTIRFSKNIFYFDNGVRYDIVRSDPGDGQKLLGDLIGGGAMESGHAKITGTGQVASQFVITLENIRPFEDIVIFDGGFVSNRSNYTMKYRVTLTFDPTLTTANYYDNISAPIIQPGFRVTTTMIQQNS